MSIIIVSTDNGDVPTNIGEQILQFLRRAHDIILNVCQQDIIGQSQKIATNETAMAILRLPPITFTRWSNFTLRKSNTQWFGIASVLFSLTSR